MVKILIKIAFLIIVTFSKGNSQIFFKLANNSKKAVVPFELYNHLIVIPVKINGVVSLNFILDTGVKTTIITEKLLIDVLRPKYHKKIRISGAAGGDGIEATVVNPLKLDLPGVEGIEQSMLVLEEDYLYLSNNIGIQVHGITGYELFRRFIIEIDYVNKLLVLHEPGHFKPKKGFVAHPIKVKDTKPYIDLKVELENSEKVLDLHLMMDTGASNSLILGLDSLYQIHLPSKTIHSIVGRGLEGVIRGYIGRVKNVHLDKFSFSDVIGSFPSEESYLEVLKNTERHGSLGGGIMSRFTVIFDYNNEIVYLKKNKNFKNPFEYNMSGMDIMVEGSDLNKFFIYSILNGSPADNAGLLVNDEIININHKSHKNWTLSEVYALLSSKKGKKVKGKVMRNGEKVKFKLYLTPAI